MATALTREIASIERDPRIPQYGGVLTNQDATLISQGQGRGLALYDDLLRDPHVYAVMNKRANGVVHREWRVEPASERRADRKAADMVRDQLDAMLFDRTCHALLLGAILKGFSIAECMWARDGREVRLAELRPRNQRRFVFDTKGRPRLLVPEAPLSGLELPPRKFAVQTHDASDEQPYGLGLGTRLFWPVWFKRQGITFWLQYVDKFAMPTVMGKHARGADEAEKAALLDVVQAVAHDTGIALPDDMELTLLEAARSGTIDSYEKLARYMDEQTSECTLGETLSTNIGTVGSKAATAEHNDVREELSKGDADLQCAVFNGGPVTWITEVNVPGARPPKVWRVFDEPEDLGARVNRDKTIHDMGFEPSEKYLQDTYGGDWRRKAPAGPGQEEAPPAPAADPPDPAFAEGGHPKGVPRDDVDELVDQLDAAAGPATDALIDQVRAVLEDADTIPDAIARLEALYPDMRLDDLADVIGEAMALADLTGRAEVGDV